MAILSGSVLACTTIIVGNRASEDGSVMVAHSEELGISNAQHFVSVPRKTYEEGDVFTLFSGATIPQPEVTYAYLASKVYDIDPVPGDFTGGINEHQVTVGNNMAWTRDLPPEYQDDPWYVDDQGVLWSEFTQLVLERAKTAREGVKLMGYLVENYGLTGDPGTMFAIADPNEGWWIEIAKADEDQWIAERSPDREATMRANAFRIGEVDFDRLERGKNPKDILYSPNIVDFAIDKGWYDPEIDGPFNFTEVYGCPERTPRPANTVRHELVDKKLADLGRNITINDLKSILRWHFEDTEMDLSDDYDTSPHFTGVRTICRHNTIMSSVAHLRNRIPGKPQMPDEFKGMIWKNMGTSCTGTFIPYYVGTLEFATPYTVGTGEYSPDSAYWIFNELTELVDEDYKERHGMVKDHWAEFESNIKSTQALDEHVYSLYREKHPLYTEEDKQSALEYVTEYSKELALQAYYDAIALVNALKE